MPLQLSMWLTPPHGHHPLDDSTPQAQTFLRTLTAMRPHAWTKCFVAALLAFLTTTAPAWTPSAAAQSENSPRKELRPGVAMLTPTDGVDFDAYLKRMVAAVKRNWYAVMPEVALMGEKGVVVITFKILQDGTVPIPEPTLQRASGTVQLDTAAMSAIRTSAPFEHLPAEFHRPHIELRFIFFYNVPQTEWRDRETGRFVLLDDGNSPSAAPAAPAAADHTPTRQMAVSITHPSTDGFDAKVYSGLVSIRINRKWNDRLPKPGPNSASEFVVLSFHIQRNGKLLRGEPTIQLSSGNADLDKSAVKAIQKSAPFDPLPAAYADSELPVAATFRYYLGPAPPMPALPPLEAHPHPPLYPPNPSN